MVPLRIHVLFHPDSAESRGLARHLYDVFTAGPFDRGVRIPVRYPRRNQDGHPPGDVPPDAEHAVYVALVDASMSRRARPQDSAIADAWENLITNLVERHPPEAGPHAVLPVSVDPRAFDLADGLSDRSFVRLEARQGRDRKRHLTQHVALRALRLLADQSPADDGYELDKLPKAPVDIFLSHTKRDLPATSLSADSTPIPALMAALDSAPVNPWHDAKTLSPASNFREEIESGVSETAALVAVLTDSWSNREWCRREVLMAKESHCPLVIVDAIEGRAVRLFPYVGNAPILRWRAAMAGSPPSDASDEFHNAWENQRREWAKEDAEDVVEATLVEALRFRHDVKRLKRQASEHDAVLGSPPEALTLAGLPDSIERVWYPDPPLGAEELQRVRSVRPGVELTTPLTQLAERGDSTGSGMVAISLSDATDAAAYGGSSEHLATLAGDLVVYLLKAGLRIGYGGVLGHEALYGEVPGDEINYIDRLFALARQHSPLHKASVHRDFQPNENWVAWPIHHRFSDAELNQYGNEAKLIERPRPEGLGLDERDLAPDDRGYFPPDSMSQRHAWARSLTDMRIDMTEASSARVAIGGKLTGYVGLWPGVFEEAVLSLRAERPLFVLGAFGGAARLMIDTLDGRHRDQLTSTWTEANNDGRSELVAEYARRGEHIQGHEALGRELKHRGAHGPAAALKNGLDDEENRELFDCDDAQRAVALILIGLERSIH